MRFVPDLSTIYGRNGVWYADDPVLVARNENEYNKC